MADDASDLPGRNPGDPNRGDEDRDPAGEARARFEDAFARLQERSKRSSEIDRESADFDTMTADHAELEMMRREAWRAKKGVVSRYEGATPDYVDTPVGMQDTTVFGRVAAIFGALLLAAVIPLLWFGLIRGGTDLDIAVDAQRIVEETTDDGRTRCILEVDVAVTNESDELWALERATAVIDRSRMNLTRTPASRQTIGTDFSATVTLTAVIAPITTDPCPALDDLDRNTLTLYFARLGGEFGELSRSARL